MCSFDYQFNKDEQDSISPVEKLLMELRSQMVTSTATAGEGKTDLVWEVKDSQKTKQANTVEIFQGLT